MHLLPKNENQIQKSSLVNPDVTKINKNQLIKTTDQSAIAENHLPYAEVLGSKKFKITQDLGPIISVFEENEFSSLQRKISVTLAFTSASSLLIGAGRYLYGFWFYGYGIGINWGQFWFKLGIGLIISLALHYLILRSRHKSAILYQNGISLHKAWKKPLTYSWSKLAGLSYLQENILFLFYQRNKFTGFIIPNQGKKVKLNRYVPEKQIINFITQVKAKLYPILEPELINKLSSGQTLYFGAVTISNNELTLNNQTQSWNNIEQIVIKDGFMQFVIQKSRDSKINIPQKVNISLIHIQNPELCIKAAQWIHAKDLKSLN